MTDASTAQNVIHIVIADDHPLMRKGITDILSLTGFDIDFEAGDGDELIKYLKVATRPPDIYILDISMPRMNGYDTLKLMKTAWPSMKVLVLSMFNNELSIIKVLTNGANGFLQKNSSPKQLIEAIRSIYTYGYYDDEPGMRKLINAVDHLPHLAPTFTPREMELLQYSCSELSYREIADLMGVGIRTVESHRDTLFAKLNIKSRTGLVMYALRNGVVPINN